jgi:hypothetical protein
MKWQNNLLTNLTSAITLSLSNHKSKLKIRNNNELVQMVSVFVSLSMWLERFNLWIVFIQLG